MPRDPSFKKTPARCLPTDAPAAGAGTESPSAQVDALGYKLYQTGEKQAIHFNELAKKYEHDAIGPMLTNIVIRAGVFIGNDGSIGSTQDSEEPKIDPRQFGYSRYQLPIPHYLNLVSKFYGYTESEITDVLDAHFFKSVIKTPKEIDDKLRSHTTQFNCCLLIFHPVTLKLLKDHPEYQAEVINIMKLDGHKIPSVGFETEQLVKAINHVLTENNKKRTARCFSALFRAHLKTAESEGRLEDAAEEESKPA